MRKLLVLAIAVLSACTPQEVAVWMEWHKLDPEAAMAHAQEALAPEPESSVWDQLAECESGGDWGISTGNGYYGGLQFSLTSWKAVGGQGYPHQASRAEQIHRAELLKDIQGWGAWPGCARKLGLL